jgi:hypothetical protein
MLMQASSTRHELVASLCQYVFIAIFMFSVIGCSTISMQKPQREFNFSEFTGLVSRESIDYAGVLLDYDLDDAKGKNVHFTSCLQVDGTSENDILTSEYTLYKLLSIHCKAIQIYIEKGTDARVSFFPQTIRKELVAAFPAVATPQVSKEAMAERLGKTLAIDEPGLKIKIVDKENADVLTSTDDITYTIMARADFNQDGIEELLVRMNWHVIDAFGKGADLFILEKKSPTDPIALTWRY